MAEIKNTYTWQVDGHAWAVNYIMKSMTHQRSRHAYLITGISDIGKSRFAHQFAQTLNCEVEDVNLRPCGQCRSCRLIQSGNHPDTIYTENDPKTGRLKIDEIRQLIRLLSLKPYDSRYRIAILNNFDGADPRAQDALLKTLEEPSAYAVLILIAQSANSIQSTILSRSQLIALRPIPGAEVEAILLEKYNAHPDQAQLLARLSSGRIEWAIRALNDPALLEERLQILDQLLELIYGKRLLRFNFADELDKLGRNQKVSVSYYLELWQSFWRDVLLIKQDQAVKLTNIDRMIEIQQCAQRLLLPDILKALQATRHAHVTFKTTNANARLIFEIMFLDYPYLY